MKQDRQAIGKHGKARSEGLTLIEVIVVMAVIAILALMGKPLLCYLSKAQMTSKVSDFNFARDLIEAHKAEHGYFPGDLQEAFGDSRVPEHLIYCVDDPDANAGHGNEFCTFFDPDNPGNNPPPQSSPQAGYILMTQNDLCACKDVDYIWATCCGMVPDIVAYGESAGVPGHPGQGPGGPGGPGNNNNGGGPG